ARKSGRNGIGLSLVKFLVELFDGTIEVTSQLEKGTTFTLTFPLTTKS
ncbi:ATP-binding protein, partial [Mitsuokella multacida]